MKDGALRKMELLPVVKKKPAAKEEIKAEEGPMELSADPGEEHLVTGTLEDHKQFSMKVRAGHGGLMAILLQGQGKDKAQIVQIGDLNCHGTPWTPMKACQHIMKEITEKAKDIISLPVAQSPGLAELKGLARQERAQLFD